MAIRNLWETVRRPDKQPGPGARYPGSLVHCWLRRIGEGRRESVEGITRKHGYAGVSQAGATGWRSLLHRAPSPATPQDSVGQAPTAPIRSRVGPAEHPTSGLQETAYNAPRGASSASGPAPRLDSRPADLKRLLQATEQVPRSQGGTPPRAWPDDNEKPPTATSRSYPMQTPNRHVNYSGGPVPTPNTSPDNQ